MKDIEATCEGCIYLDEYFGDCCHPLSEGCNDLTWTINKCGKNHKFKRIKNEKENRFNRA